MIAQHVEQRHLDDRCVEKLRPLGDRRPVLRREEVERRWGSPLYRKFQLYLWGCVDGFRRDMIQAGALSLFGLTLSECEEPQFLRYRTGDFFVAHQDGNTPLFRSDKVRLISAIIFLRPGVHYADARHFLRGGARFFPDGTLIRTLGERGK